MKKSIRLFITGSVQGIFFKHFIKQHAERLGIKGHLRSLEDGRVEIFAEADQKEVDAFLAICRRGPQHAYIRSIEEQEAPFQDFKEFKLIKF